MSGDLPDYATALEAALAIVDAGPIETAAFDVAAGRTLRTPIVADRDLPPFDRSAMDGYAVRTTELGGRTPVVLPVAASVAAGAPAPDGGAIAANACVRIATGAPVPAGFDAVVPHERTDRGDPVAIDAPDLTPGDAVHRRGADARAGDELVPAGTVLGPAHLALAASVGATTLEVARRPRAIVLTSGDEVLPPATTELATHQIRNSNAVQLAALLDRIGATPVRHEHLLDEAGATREAVARALGDADLVVTVGGVSAGERDHFPDAFAAANVSLAVRGAAIQPGKPITIGRAPNGSIVVALPGNPVSSLACGCLFAWPIVRRLSGASPALPWTLVRVAAPVRPNPRRAAFRPAIVEPDGRVRVPTWAGSGDLAHVAACHGLLALPVQAAPVPEDSEARFLPWP